MRFIEYGVRLTDLRIDPEWIVEVPSRSLDHAEDVANWHNDPKHESVYKAEVIQRQKIITNWVTIAPRKVHT